MQPQRPGQPAHNQAVEHGTHIVLTFLNAFTMPLEMVLRPFYGSQYFGPAVHLCAVLVMLALPMIAAAFNSVPAIFIAAHIQRSQALFTLWSFSKLFFLLSVIHGLRTAWLKFDVSREDHSRYEGPALLPIRLLPWGNSFWICRILVEPAVVIFLALFMRRIMIFDASLSNFLLFASLCLVGKQYMTWHGSWSFLRDVLDAKYAGPIVATLLDESAKSKELEKVHLCTLPKNTPQDIRRAAVQHIARVVTRSDYPITPGENNAAD